MARGDRICELCGKKYVYCPSCKKGNPVETWRYKYCGEDCRKIFRACADFHFGHMNASQAQDYLKDIDLSDKTKYSDDIRMELSAIYAEEAEKKEEVVEQPKEETKAESNEVSEPKESDTIVELPIKPVEKKESRSFNKHYNDKHNKTRFVND